MTAFVHRPQQLTLVTRSAMASSSPGCSSVERSRKREPQTSQGPESNTDQQPFRRSTLGAAGPASDLNPAHLPPYWLVRGTRSLPIGGCPFPRECVSRAIPRRNSRGGGARARSPNLVWLRACALRHLRQSPGEVRRGQARPRQAKRTCVSLDVN